MGEQNKLDYSTSFGMELAILNEDGSFGFCSSQAALNCCVSSNN